MRTTTKYQKTSTNNETNHRNRDPLRLRPLVVAARVIKGRRKLCGNVTFNQGVFLRKVSALVNPDGRDAYLPIPTFTCTACGNVNDEFVPAELKNKIQLV